MRKQSLAQIIPKSKISIDPLPQLHHDPNTLEELFRSYTLECPSLDYFLDPQLLVADFSRAQLSFAVWICNTTNADVDNNFQLVGSSSLAKKAVFLLSVMILRHDKDEFLGELCSS